MRCAWFAASIQAWIPLYPGDRYFLVVRKARRISDSEVVCQQVPIEGTKGDRKRIGKDGVDANAIKQSREGIRDLLAGIRATRPAGAERVKGTPKVSMKCSLPIIVVSPARNELQLFDGCWSVLMKIA